MITGWVKNLIGSVIPGGADQGAGPNAGQGASPHVGQGASKIGQGAQAFEKRSKVRLIAVTDGLGLIEEAQRKSRELLTVVRNGSAHLERFKFWLRARRKIRNNLADFYDIPDILEEVTEKIAEVSQHDPYYKRLFS